MRNILGGAAFAAVAALGATSHAGLNYSNGPAGAFAAGYTISSPADGNATDEAFTNQQISGPAALTQTFVPATGFKLDKLVFLSGGMAGGSGTLNIYPINLTVTGQGGGNGDGYVNNQYETGLLGGGAGLPITIAGNGGTQLLSFDLTGADEISLVAGREYAIDFALTSGQIALYRSNADAISTGNLYQVAGSSAPGTRTQVGGSPQRDAFFAAYAVQTPEPASLSLIGAGAAAVLRRRRRA